MDFKEEFLIMPCPIKGHKCKQGNITWVHAKCKSYVKISNEGYIRCSNSSCNLKENIVEWRFDCGNHDFMKANPQALNFCLCSMLSLTGVNPTWVMEVTDCVWKQVGLRR
jgi:hypothetical protein